MKQIAILGSTGSIGRNVLNVVRHLKSQFVVKALAANENIELLEQQIIEFNPSVVAVFQPDKAIELQKKFPHLEVLSSMEGLKAVASLSGVQMVISAISGIIGLQPTVEAIINGKEIALANKEVLVSGGKWLMDLVKKHQTRLIPVDSEHSAIFQCLKNEKLSSVRRLILTSSGGPFYAFNKKQLEKATLEQALNHPTWKMGRKITVDSSTLMNKGLEVIEAHWLFDIPLDQIEVIVHPQSIIHSMVEYEDGSILAQMNEPNMITPIQYAMTYPNRCPSMLSYFDFSKHAKLEFMAPDLERFPCLRLAYEALRRGGSLSCYMNAVNEVLVKMFLERKISWYEISTLLERLMNDHVVRPIESLESIIEVDQQARKDALNCLMPMNAL